MYKRFHAFDRHVSYTTIKCISREGEQKHFINRCKDVSEYVKGLNSEDVVILEAGNGAFWLADKIEKTGAGVFVIHPRNFKLICQSTKKTDKNDVHMMVTSLFRYCNDNDNYGLPLVFKPKAEVRILRRLFSGLKQLNKTVVAQKNCVLGMLRDCGVTLGSDERKTLLSKSEGISVLEAKEIDIHTKTCVELLLKPLYASLKAKAALKEEIIKAGVCFQDEVKLLISIQGISPLMALAFLSDIADLNRFRSIRKLNAYLGLVPITKASGGKCFQGRIIKQSRSTTRTLLTQSLPHIAKSSPILSAWYEGLKSRRGAGRARIALIRRIVKIMRRMLLDKKIFHYKSDENYKSKLSAFNRVLGKGVQLDKIIA